MDHGSLLQALQRAKTSFTVGCSKRETDETPVYLPTTEPGSPQVQYTLASGDMPVLGIDFASKYIVYLVAGCKNTDAAVAHTVQFKTFRWTGSWTLVTSGSKSVPANQYWTLSAFFGGANNEVAVGDQYAVSLWCADADKIDYRYKALAVMPTRLNFDPRRMCLQDLSVTVDYWPKLTGGSSPYVYTKSELFVYHGTKAYASFTTTPGTQTYSFLLPHATYKVLRAKYPDETPTVKSYDLTHATRFPYHYAQIVPTELIYRKLPSAVVA